MSKTFRFVSFLYNESSQSVTTLVENKKIKILEEGREKPGAFKKMDYATFFAYDSSVSSYISGAACARTLV